MSYNVTKNIYSSPITLHKQDKKEEKASDIANVNILSNPGVDTYET